MKTGLVHVYTGDGKGKTSAAIGLAVRAAGRDLKVVFIQFLKSEDSGEVILLEKYIPLVKVLRFNTQNKFIWNMNDDERQLLRAETREGFNAADRYSVKGDCDILVLDEIFGSCRNGFVNEDEILTLIKNRNSVVELVLTGRDAPEKIIEASDLVTEMKNIKHPFDKGIKARIGIER